MTNSAPQSRFSGDTVVVGSQQEDSCATGVNGIENDNACSLAGAAYVFQRTGVVWAQQAYLKASNTDNDNDEFGVSVAISGDTVVVGANREASCATGVDGDQTDNGCIGISGPQSAGAAYVFQRTAGAWAQQAYLKASNTAVPIDIEDPPYDFGASFGLSVAVSGDTVVVGAQNENSCATGAGGDEADEACLNAGAAYVFLRTGGVWAQQAYLKASNTDAGDAFGWSVAISGDMVVVGARSEDSCATGVDGNETSNGCGHSSAAYVYLRTAGFWVQRAYLKASNTGNADIFGYSVAISGDTVVVGAQYEDSCDTGVGGNGASNSCSRAGAAYVFTIVLDQDSDGVLDQVDNCPTVPNPGQEQSGNNVGGLFGDACVDPSAVVEGDVGPGAVIGNGAIIEAGATVFENATVGANATIGAGAKIEAGADIGDNAVIGPGATVEGGAVLGDDVVLGPAATIKEGVIIGDGTEIGVNSTTEDDAIVGEGAIIGANVMVKTGAEIGPGAMIGDVSVIEDGARIGAGAVIENNVLVKENACVGSSTESDTTTVGANSTIQEDVEIGDGESIPPGSDISSDVGETCNAPDAPPPPPPPSGG